ncbi:MAG: ABC transporter ATP-binding protein [Armatimonadota bacterium]|nr:ABC transporter ATP-binding protein [Armatimonadota bacterium]
MTPYAIETHQLRKVYRSLWRRQTVVAVESLDLKVPAGSVFGFLGPNGAGKTTTIMMLLGNVYPTSGSFRIFGRPITDMGVRRRIGFLPEKFQFHDLLTAEELLWFHGRLTGMDRHTLARRVPEVLEQVGLRERARSRVREFSKGMQQRLGIAQAILHDPDLIILDEPTSALDPLGRRDVRDLILHLKSRGKTVFLNSHLLSEVEMVCDEVAILRAGRVQRQGDLETLLQVHPVVDVELRTPSEQVLQAVREVATLLSANGTRFSAEVQDESDIPVLARRIVEAGGELMRFAPRRESLEDLFVRVVEEAK